jgi:hypothetical protein
MIQRRRATQDSTSHHGAGRSSPRRVYKLRVRHLRQAEITVFAFGKPGLDARLIVGY